MRTWHLPLEDVFSSLGTLLSTLLVVAGQHLLVSILTQLSVQ